MSLISQSLNKAHEERARNGVLPSFNLLTSISPPLKENTSFLRPVLLTALPVLVVAGLVYLAMGLEKKGALPIPVSPTIPAQTASVKLMPAPIPVEKAPTLIEIPVAEEIVELQEPVYENEPVPSPQPSAFKTASIETPLETTSWIDDIPENLEAETYKDAMEKAPASLADPWVAPAPRQSRVQISVKRRDPADSTLERDSNNEAENNARLEQDRLRNGKFYFQMGVFYQQTGNEIEALDYYNKALQLNPSNAEIYNNRSLIYKELGKQDKAIEGFLQAIRLNPKYVKAYNNIGLVYLTRRNFRAAVSNFRKAIQIDPLNLESYNNLAIAFKKQNRLNDARGLYQTILKRNPKHAQAHYNLALLYEQEGDYPNAILHYEQFTVLGKNVRPGLVSKVKTHLGTLQ